MKIVLIYNPKSGSAVGLAELRRICQRTGIVIDYSFTISQLGSKKLATLIKAGVTVAAVGGDGTLNSVAARLVGSPSCLLPLPGGTLNHFAVDIGLPDTIEKSLSAALKTKVRQVDVGFVNDQIFLNNASLGLYPLSLQERKKTQSLIGKWPSALRAAFIQLVRFRRYRLLVDGVQVRSPFIFVGNNRYHFKLSRIPKRRSLTTGKLGIMIALTNSRLKLLKIAATGAQGKSPDVNEFRAYSSSQLRIDSHHAQLAVSFDGEVRKLDTPLIFRSAPASLNILGGKTGK